MEQPAFGDVTVIVQTFWRVLLGIATLGSFAFGVYDIVAGVEFREGPAARFEVSGDDNDVDLHVHVPRAVRRSDLTSADGRQSAETVRRQVLSEPGVNGTPDEEVLDDR